MKRAAKIFWRRFFTFLEDLLYALIITFSMIIAFMIFIAAVGPYFLDFTNH